jgi:hypothetical protein
LGSWRCPSSNSVDVYLEGDDGSGLRHLTCQWDQFPLSTPDEVHWTAVILPALTRTAQEYLEKTGGALVVRL